MSPFDSHAERKEQEIRKPILYLKQSYFEHVQKITNYNNDVVENDYSKISVDVNDLDNNHKIPFAPVQEKAAGGFETIIL